MAFETLEVDTKKLTKQMRQMLKLFSTDAILDAAEKPVQAVLEEAKRAPIPYDHGLLAGSDAVEREGDALIFGFNKAYAAIQDVGGKGGNLPPKPFGSEVGPNRYFSETLAQNSDFILKQLALNLQHDLEKLEKKGGKK